MTAGNLIACGGLTARAKGKARPTLEPIANAFFVILNNANDINSLNKLDISLHSG